MIPHLVYYQLAIIVCLWLCLMLHYAWPSRGVLSPKRLTESAPTKFKRNRTSEPNGDQWLIVTTIVEDPQYLNTRYARSTHFKKVADTPWTPTACEAS